MNVNKKEKCFKLNSSLKALKKQLVSSFNDHNLNIFIIEFIDTVDTMLLLMLIFTNNELMLSSTTKCELTLTVNDDVEKVSQFCNTADLNNFSLMFEL